MNQPLDFSSRWAGILNHARHRAEQVQPIIVEGRLTRMVGLTLEAIGCRAPVGAQCEVIGSAGDKIEAEVVGFSGQTLYLMPTGHVHGLEQDARVIPRGMVGEAQVGHGLLGRVVDSAGVPLDGKGPLHLEHRVPLAGVLVNPLARTPIRDPLDVGIRSINSLLTVGRGQRLGLFAGSGVGKSVLLGMMTRYTAADITVVGLIGERGREVKDFIENTLGPEGMKRAVVVAVPADNPPLRRLHGAMLATCIAEYFRDQGFQVLLLMDSLTRYAQAQREIALAIHEPPATKGYPPSVFAKLPQLVERAGNGEAGGGSITAFYTVLAEGDDQNDPVVDAARAILDGHIVLSRQLADMGHYPAIDIEASVSRAMTDIVTRRHQDMARAFKQTYSLYQQNRDLINVGAYAKGSNAAIDRAISTIPTLQRFLQQSIHECVTFQDSLNSLEKLFPGKTG